MELDTPVPDLGHYLRWIVWYNLWHGAGQFLRVVKGYAQSMIDGSVALPWEYERIFFRYKWKIVKGYWKKMNTKSV